MDRRFAPRDEIGATNKEGEELSHHGSFDSRAFRMQRRIAQRLHWRSGYITNIGRATDDRCHMFGICFTILLLPCFSGSIMEYSDTRYVLCKSD